MITVTLLTKPGCHLCDMAKHTIERVRQQFAFVIVVRDITENPADFEKYKHAIPVILVNDAEIARGRLKSDVLIEAIHSAEL